MFQKSPLRIYLIVASLVVVFVVLLINFLFLPRFVEILLEASPEKVKTIKNKISVLTIGLLAFIFLFDFYFLNAEKKLK